MVLRRIKDIVEAQIGSYLAKEANYNNAFDNWEQRVHHSRQNHHATYESDSELSLEKQYYANLELAHGASFSQIKQQYRKLMKSYHPDCFADDPQKQQLAQTIAQRMNEAYNYFEDKFNKHPF